MGSYVCVSEFRLPNEILILLTQSPSQKGRINMNHLFRN